MPSSGFANSCTQVSSLNTCKPLSTTEQLSVDLCEVEMKNAGCEEFLKKNPQLIVADKARQCEVLASCPASQKVSDYTSACLKNWGTAWGDLVVGIYQLLSQDIKMAPETKAREDFFASCTSADCKRQMLGPYAHLFTSEEIAGHKNGSGLDPKDPKLDPRDLKLDPQDPKLDPRDAKNDNYLQGYSAKVLYKKLRLALAKKMKSGSLDQPVLEPWSGKKITPLGSTSEMIDRALQAMGISHTACYNPIVLSEMRCYALFSVLDPLLFAGAASKVAKLSGLRLEKALATEAADLASKEKLAERAANAALAESKALTEKRALALQAHNDASIDEGIARIMTSEKESIQRAVAHSDPVVKLWKETGVTLNADGSLKLNSTHVAQNLESKVDTLVKAGQIKESEALRPVLLYKLDKKIIGVSPSEIPPLGAKRIRPDESILKSEDFLKLVASGKYPMGRDQPIRAGQYAHSEAAFVHDMGHYSAFLRNPEFMAGSRDVAKKILATTDPELKRTFQARYTFAAEYSKSFPKEQLQVAQQEVASIKNQLQLSDTGPSSISAYEKSLEKLNTDELKTLWSKVAQSKFSNTPAESLGGGVQILDHRYPADFAQDFKEIPHGYNFSNSTPAFDQRFPQAQMADISKIKNPLNEVGLKRVRHELAAHLAKTDAFIRIKPADWMTEGFQGAALPRSGNISKLCRAIDRTTDNSFYATFCN